jgi:tetratricopeptide (TPR) repeat protein
LYEELNPIRRRRLHLLAAEGIERNREATFCAVEKLAHHYIQAGDHERGLKFSKRAASEAERVFAFDEAVAAFKRALDCAEALNLTDEQLALEESIGKAYMLHGETILAAEHFERALKLATDPDVRTHLQCQAAASLVTVGEARGVSYLQEALKALDPVTNPLETANAISTEARFHHLAGRHRKAIELLQRANDLVEPTAQHDDVSSFAAPLITRIYAYAAGAHQHSGLYADADVWARRALEFGEKHNIYFALASGYEFLGEDAVHTGDYGSGLKYAEKEFEIAAKLQSRERRAWTLLYAALCYMELGDFEKAEESFREGLALANAIGEYRVKALHKANLAWLYARTGRFAEALALATENNNEVSPNLIYTRFEAFRGLAEVRFSRAKAAFVDGSGIDELDEAERLCNEASAFVMPTESRVSQLWLGPLHIDVLMAQAKRAEEKKDVTLADTKRKAARALLEGYQALVIQCQSQRFTDEAARLAAELS